MSRIFQHLSLRNLIKTLETMATENNPIYRTEFPEFAIESIRLRTFKDWPKTMKQKPEQMADAGFFYTQISDRVICFSCGGGLCKWDENDDPFEQHAIWYSKCNYLQLVKGPEYVASIGKKFDKIQNGKNNNNQQSSTPSSQKKDEHTKNTSNYCNNCKNHSLSNNNQNGNTKLNDTRLCQICCTNEYNTAFIPCGHVLACAKCAAAQTKCPLCRKPFESIYRIFFP